MDPRQSNDGSQGGFSGGNIPPYQPAWNQFMYGYQGHPSYFPQGVQQFAPNFSMMHPSNNGQQVFHPAESSGACLQDEEADVLEVPPCEAPTGQGKKIKLSNFNPTEDVTLVKSCHNQSLLQCEQEKIRIMREKHDMDRKIAARRRRKEEKLEDERILGVDLNACAPAQRVYYEALQEEIFEKIVARRRKRHGPVP